MINESFIELVEIFSLILSILFIYLFISRKKIIYIFTGVILLSFSLISYFYKYELYNKLLQKGSGYRLGDMVKNSDFRNRINGKKFHIKIYPNSIVSEYMKRTDKDNDFETLNQIVKERSDIIKNNDLENKIYFHLRTGDVINKFSKENLENILNDNIESIGKYKRYFKTKKEYIKIIDKLPDIKNLVLISSVKGGGGTKPNSNFINSYTYINHITKIFEEKGFVVEKRLNQDPDEDFIIMSSSKHFIPSKGGYSQLIKSMVNLNNNFVYE